jgi:hypothetical protein
MIHGWRVTGTVQKWRKQKLRKRLIGTRETSDSRPSGIKKKAPPEPQRQKTGQSFPKIFPGRISMNPVSACESPTYPR